jgi:peptidoglycan/LPS O-acetylase OafA/YrhL
MLPEKNLRENLFSVEPVSPERQERFRVELAQIVEPRLPRSHRLYYIMVLVCSVIGICGAVPGILFDTENRWLQGVALVVWTASAGWVYHILRRGCEPLRAMQGMSKVFAGLSVVVAAFLIYHGLQNPSLAGVLWALLGLLVFLLTSFINLWNRVITAERTMREDVLRVEYRLADLASRLPSAGR